VEMWQAILESQADQQLAPDGADANCALLLSALEAARDSGAHYDYVLVTGDFLGHNFPEKYRRYYRADGKGYEGFVIKTMAFVNRMIEQAFPAIPIYAAFGNNDSVIEDYALQGPGLLAAMAKEWKIVAAGSEAKKDFLLGGYYVVPHPTVPDLEFIVLNTAYWSSKLKTGAASSGADAGSVELSWFTAQLDRLRRAHKAAAIMMHIPPGIDAYDSAKPGRCATPTLFWKEQYLESFLATVRDHEDVVRDGYAGHTHIDDFRVLTDANGMPYFQTHIAPSISRDHHNNPGFEVGVYDKTSGAMVDYAAAYLRNSPAANSTKPAWAFAYDFRQQSHFPSYSPASLQTIALLIRSGGTIRGRIMEAYGARTSSDVPISMKDWRFYSCAQTEVDPESFSKCACPPPGGQN
jgi:sphingomyelin phosphodiesterase acid-like 3